MARASDEVQRLRDTLSQSVEALQDAVTFGTELDSDVVRTLQPVMRDAGLTRGKLSRDTEWALGQLQDHIDNASPRQVADYYAHWQKVIQE